MQNKTLPIFKPEPNKPKLEWIRQTIYPKQGDHHVRDLFPSVGAGSRQPCSAEGETFYICREAGQF